MVVRFVKESRIPAPPADVFAYFERPEAFRDLVPPDEPVEVVQAPRSLEVGTVVVVRVKFGPVPIEWVVEHVEYTPGVRFVDRQVRGPFASWTHRHEFADDGDGGTILRDVIDYEPPLGVLGMLIGGKHLRSKLQRLFDYRHEVVRGHFAAESGSSGAAEAV